MSFSFWDQDCCCPECGRPYTSGFDRAVGIAWMILSALAVVAVMVMLLVILT